MLLTPLVPAVSWGTSPCGCREGGFFMPHWATGNQHSLTHGHAVGYKTTRTWRSWQAMKQRCSNPKLREWPHYGGRGITVCNRWLHSFANFLEDMGPAPDDLTLDRIDVNGNYEPGNCRWATWLVQKQNRRPFEFCKRGHALEGNVYICKTQRLCRTCALERSRLNKQKHRAAA